MWWALIGVLAAVMPVLAQDIPAPPEIFTTKRLKDALEETIHSRKFLIIYPHFDKPGWREMDDTTWKNPTLATWVMWHAVAIRLDPSETPQDYSLMKSAMGAASGKIPMEKFPHVLVFADGKFVRAYPDPNFQRYLYESDILGGKPDVTVFYPKAVQILFMLDFLGDKMRAMNPMWMSLHDEVNPAPPAPPLPPPLCQSDDGAAPPVADPAPGPDGVVDVLAMLEHARDLAAHKELYDATGVYSWLWERADAFDPSFRAARMSFVADEISDLARARDGSMRRFMAIRDRMASRQPWWTWGDLLEWIVLSRALGHDSEVVEYFSQYTVDQQEQTMIPPAHRSAYNALSNLDDISNPRDTSKAAFDRINARIQNLKSMRPAPGQAAEWSEVADLRARLLVDEGSRLHAALLLRGDTPSAMNVARLVLGVRNDGAAKVSLVTTALAAGAPPQPEHLRWLLEAESSGVAAPIERRRVQNAVPASR